jgi:hypothetical protein
MCRGFFLRSRAWATTQNNLGVVLLRLGEREGGTARLEEAVAAFRDALSVFESAQASYYVNLAHDNLARAERMVQRRQN